MLSEKELFKGKISYNLGGIWVILSHKDINMGEKNSYYLYRDCQALNKTHGCSREQINSRRGGVCVSLNPLIESTTLKWGSGETDFGYTRCPQFDILEVTQIQTNQWSLKISSTQEASDTSQSSFLWNRVGIFSDKSINLEPSAVLTWDRDQRWLKATSCVSIQARPKYHQY